MGGWWEVRRTVLHGLLVGVLAATLQSESAAQGPKIVPPRPCDAPAGTVTALTIANRSARDARPRIAVVRFEESVSDAARLHLTWAVGAHITKALAAIPALNVETPGTVARAWTDAGARVDEVARLLAADFVVTGRSAMRGSAAEITVTLWHAGAGATRWERTFVYPSLSLREIEDSSVALIGSYVGVRTELQRSAMRATPTAYEAIARGDYFLGRAGIAGADSARAAYERATKADPRSALAKARLARSYAVLLARSGRVKGLDAKRAVNDGLALVDAALREDPRLAEAWTARAMLLRFGDPGQFAGVVDAHVKAVALAPRDADAHQEYGQTLHLLGNDRAAVDHFRRALAVEPNRAATLRAYGELEMLGRRYASSCALLNASVGAGEYDPLAYAVRAQVRLELGEFRDAYADAEIASRLSGERWGDALAVMVLAGAQNVDRAKRETRLLANSRLRANTTLGVREARYLAIALALTGDRERAILALSRARPQGAELTTALRDPMLDPLRSDARFRSLVAAARGTLEAGGDVARAPSR